MSSEMLEELRKMPPKVDERPLHQQKAEFEELQALENFDPLANDPVEQAIKLKNEQYRPPGLDPPKLTNRNERYERLTKPPIQNLANRKPPDWEDARKQRIEHTKEQIRLGLAPPEMMRQFEPGPWDNDPSFWSGRQMGEREVVLEHELAEDIIFDY